MIPAGDSMKTTFSEEGKALLMSRGFILSCDLVGEVAYRRTLKNEYVVIWPEGKPSFVRTENIEEWLGTG